MYDVATGEQPVAVAVLFIDVGETRRKDRIACRSTNFSGLLRSDSSSA
jgi:hypothetical protein